MTEPILLLPTSQPTRSDAVKNRAHLLDTARRLFCEQGVESVSMSALAEEAGLGKGTLYRHFQNKGELIVALLDHDQRDLQARALAYMREQANPSRSLRWFMAEVIGFVERNEKYLCAMVVPEVLDHPAHWWWRQTIRGLLTQIAPAGDLDYLTDVLYTHLDIPTLVYLRNRRGYSVERIVAGLNGLLDKVLK